MASPFIESEWIGKGKEYDIAKIPEHVSEAKKQLLNIPDAVEAMIPHTTMPLRDFLTMLSQKPTSKPTGLYLSKMDSASFSSLNRLSPLLKKASEEFKK